MRQDLWLGERLGRCAWTVEEGDGAAEIGPREGAFLQAKVPAGDVARVVQLEDAGFRTVDVNVTLRREPGPFVGERRFEVRHARSGDRESVTAIAGDEYRVSRFHSDPAIPDALATAIKQDWVENFFSGGRGDRLLVAQQGAEPIGFLLALDSSEAAVIDLIAVRASARGRGVGGALVSKLIEGRREVPVLVGTQVSNVAALRFYERLGFTVREAKFVLHRHD